MSTDAETVASVGVTLDATWLETAGGPAVRNVMSWPGTSPQTVRPSSDTIR